MRKAPPFRRQNERAPTIGDVTSEHGIADRSEQPSRATVRQAVTVAVTLAVLTALAVITFSFGTATASQSIDGCTATSSQWLDVQPSPTGCLPSEGS